MATTPDLSNTRMAPPQLRTAGKLVDDPHRPGARRDRSVRNRDSETCDATNAALPSQLQKAWNIGRKGNAADAFLTSLHQANNPENAAVKKTLQLLGSGLGASVCGCPPQSVAH